MNIQRFFKIAFVCSGFFLVNACSSGSSTSIGQPPSQQQQQQPPKDLPTPNSGSRSPNQEEIAFQNFGIIREFGGTDHAALFGLLPKSGNLQINKVVAPAFIQSVGVGKLSQTSIEKFFTKTAKPISQAEKQDLLSKFDGATVIYAEGYNGNLCNTDEITNKITATGFLDQTSVAITFQFEALPSANGDCEFHIFGIVFKYVSN